MEDKLLEEHLVDEYLTALSSEWLISREVEGTSVINGKLRRIDAVIKSKTHPHMVFGIEFKRPDLGSFAKFTHWFKQAIIYTQCLWHSRTGEKRKLPILIAPKPEYGQMEHTFVFTRLLGEFGIGDICKEWEDYHKKFRYTIRIKETRIWCNCYGYNEASIKQDFNKYLEL